MWGFGVLLRTIAQEGAKIGPFYCINKSILIESGWTSQFESGSTEWKKYIGIKNRPFLFFIYIKATKNVKKWK